MSKYSRISSIFLPFAFLVGFVLGLGGLWQAIQMNTELRYFLFEQATDNLPQAAIAEFIQSIVQKNKAAAHDLWEVYQDPSTAQQKALEERKEKVISYLMTVEIQPEYLVLSTEWWSTCCEPRVINDSRSAGGARVNVQLMDKNGLPLSYIFDVFTRDPYWGSAEGYPPRDWVIRDVYPNYGKPMFWLFEYEPIIRLIPPPEG